VDIANGTVADAVATTVATKERNFTRILQLSVLVYRSKVLYLGYNRFMS
jgi:hypothetical protein